MSHKKHIKDKKRIIIPHKSHIEHAKVKNQVAYPHIL